MPYIEVIQPEAAEGELKAIYDDLVETRGKIAEVHKIQSLNPESIVKHMDLYMTIMFGKSPLRRAQREMIAVVVSKGNDCEYCQTHHGSALNHYWKDDERVAQLRKDYTTVGLSEVDEALCTLAWQLTKAPGQDHESQIQQLRNLGLSDRAVLDATLVVAYFNFVNRMVMGLGVQLEKDKGKGYRYD